MFPNGITAIDDRVMASALTDSEIISSRRDTSAETEMRAGSPPGAISAVGNKSGRLRFGFRGVAFLNVADEPKAALMQRPNKSLVGPVVTKRSPGAIDAAAERSLGDDPAIPDRLDQFILADNSIMVAHQMNDEIEHLRLDMNGLRQVGVALAG